LHGEMLMRLIRFLGDICAGGGVFGGECVGPGIECLGLGSAEIKGNAYEGDEPMIVGVPPQSDQPRGTRLSILIFRVVFGR
jgi:hypothetical protein